PGLGPGVLAGGLDLLPARVDGAGERLEPGTERVQVTERAGVGHRLQQPLHGGLRLGGGEVRRRDALLDQRHLGLERLELAPEERERLFRAPRRPRADHPLAIGGTHVDRPVGVYPTPGIVGGGHGEPPGSSAAPGGCPGRRVAQVCLMVTLLITTFSLGAPSPAPEYVHEVPALATFWRISRPDVIVPNGV